MILVVFFASLLVLPMIVLITKNGTVVDTGAMIVSTMGFALLLHGISILIKKASINLATAIVSSLLLAALFVRFLFGFLYDFSGRGFGSEFFAHINRTSLAVGLSEYSSGLLTMLVLFAGSVFVCGKLIKRQNDISRTPVLLALIASLPLIYFGSSASPEIQFAQAYMRYTQPYQQDSSLSREETRQQAVALLNTVRPTSSAPLEKHQVRANVPQHPYNLILVYLESFNEILTDQEHYPGLTPRLAELKQRYHGFSQVHSSAYLTIEGIANSQCGTLINMEHANNSLTTRKGRMPSLPCLGDILNSAGYRQVYLGGAEVEFAGKGPFLREHGYDELLGWKYWDGLGHEAIGRWGLADTILFDQALERAKRLNQQSAPFNLTLLTLGTHLPGFTYDGCPEYSEDKSGAFLNAIHCTDFLLGQFVDRLEESGVLEDTVLFIQADHGMFENSDMKALFGDSVADKRLLTVLALPEALEEKYLPKLAKDIEDSNVNTVATLLDIMQISHNVDFVFARSRFDDGVNRDYHITRREDYLNGQSVVNTPSYCTESESDSVIALPLDKCSKSKVMNAVTALNLSYSRHDSLDNGVCDLSAEVYLEANSGDVRVKWGNQNLSGQFYHRGTRLGKSQYKGVYAVLLDGQDNVVRSIFFGSDNNYDLWHLRKLLKSLVRGERILLISNINVATMAPDSKKILPEQLLDQTLVYGTFDGKRLIPELAEHSPDLKIRFVPASCSGGVRQLSVR